jgi:hypothetical protein
VEIGWANESLYPIKVIFALSDIYSTKTKSKTNLLQTYICQFPVPIQWHHFQHFLTLQCLFKECIAGSGKIGGDGKSGSALERCLRPGQTISYSQELN